MAASPESWSELDALVDAELNRALARRTPVAEPEVDEALFLDRATQFLLRHPEPHRLISTLAERFPDAPDADAGQEAPAGQAEDNREPS